MIACRTSCGIVVMMLGTSASLAHDTWLDVAQRDAAGVDLVLTSGMAFPESNHAIDPTRIARAELRTGTRRDALTVGTRDAHALALRGALARSEAGIATVVLQPKVLELSADNVREYLDELEADAGVRAAWAKSGRWRERYRKVAKVVVRDSEVPLDDALLGSTNLAFELSLRRDPFAQGAEGRLEVCAFAGGAPVAAQLLRVHGGPSIATARTGDDGCARLASSAPKLLVSAVRLRAAGEPDLEWESDFATLVCETATRAVHGGVSAPAPSILRGAVPASFGSLQSSPKAR